MEKLPNLIGAKSALPVSRWSLGDYLLDWLNTEHQPHIAHTTYKRYFSLAQNHIVPNLGTIELQKLKASDIQGLLTTMRVGGQSPRSQQQARALLSIALSSAADKDYIAINPVSKVRNPVNKTHEIQPLTIDEVRRLLDTFDGTKMGARLHIALICGLRQGEALGLRWQDVDLEEGLLDIRVQIQTINGKRDFVGLKTDRSRRTVALTQQSIKALKAYKAMQRATSEVDLVFPGSDGLPMSATIDHQEWKRTLRLCGIKPRRLHDARHTAATLMYSQGVGIEVISRALGHSSSAITSKLYVHSAIQPQIEAAMLLDRILA